MSCTHDAGLHLIVLVITSGVLGCAPPLPPPGCVNPFTGKVLNYYFLALGKCGGGGDNTRE